MNLPNKLTILRVIMIPFFVFFLLAPFFDGYGNYIALVIFIIASLTDLADGKIARKYNLISGFRLVASDNGVVIAASYWGKFKTTFQMLMIIFTIFNIYLENDVLDVISNILVYVALALTVISLIDYMLKNKDVLKDQK